MIKTILNFITLSLGKQLKIRIFQNTRSYLKIRLGINSIFIYIAKNFIYRFFGVIFSIALLIFIINLFDVMSGSNKDNPIPFIKIFEMAILQVPAFLEDIAMFLIMLSVMITLFNFCSKSEITVMRVSGMSLWQILFPIIVSSFVIGILFILFFNPLNIVATKKYMVLQQNFTKFEKPSDILSPKSGIWLRQKNLVKNHEEIVIRASSINKKTLELSDINLWFFDSEGRFYQKIDAKNMILHDDYWQLNDIIANNDFNINRKLPDFKVLTNLQSHFIAQKIINNFEDAKSFSVFDLPRLIYDLEESGFSSRKFRVYYYSLLNKPLIFIAAVLIACFFSLNSSRNKNNIIYIVAGIMFGLILYISLSVVQAFGSSGIIPPFAATWVISVITISLSILLVFRKEHG